jgi:hypothetical protein
LRQINSLLLYSGLLIKINNHTEAVRQISKILELLDKMIDENNKKNIQYNLSMFIFNCLISEKILYLLSLIADKSELKKSKMVIYVNLLDLSPIYNSRLRLFILADMQKFCYDFCTNLNKRMPEKDLNSNKDLITMMLFQQKIRYLYHSSNDKKKNVILLFDLNFPILSDLNFLEKLKKYFLNKKKHKNNFYISFFEDRLFVFSDLIDEKNKMNKDSIINNFGNKIEKLPDKNKNLYNENENKSIDFWNIIDSKCKNDIL